MTGAGEIALMLAARADVLVLDLLPGGHREGHEWRCGSVAGEPGDSLGVHLTGTKSGRWADFSTDQKGDALDLVRVVLGLGTGEALTWSRRWLGIDHGSAAMPARPTLASASPPAPTAYPAHCRKAWDAAPPILSTRAETYFTAPGARFNDAHGAVARLPERHARRTPARDT